MNRMLITVAATVLLGSSAFAAEGGAAAGAATGAVVGGPVGAAVGAGVGDAATGPDRTRVIERREGCATRTVRKENDLGDSKTVTRSDCD